MIFCSVCLTLSSCEGCISLSLCGSPSTLDIDWKHKLTRKSRTTVKNTFPFTHTHILNFFMVCVRQVAAWTAPSLLLSQLSRCCTVPASGRYTCMHLVTWQGRGYCQLHTVYTITDYTLTCMLYGMFRKKGKTVYPYPLYKKSQG